jgi:hypothetical protein
MIVKNILTDLAVESAQPKSKPLKVANETGSSSETAPATVRIDKDYKLSDGGGLSLIVIQMAANGGISATGSMARKAKSLWAYTRRSPWRKRAKSVTNARVNSTRVLIPAHRAKKRVGRVNRSETIHFASYPINGWRRFLLNTVSRRITQSASGLDLRMTFSRCLVIA